MEDFLRKVPLFAELPDEDLSRLCEMVEVVHLPAGQDLFKEGSSGDRAYIIRSGEVEILKEFDNRTTLLSLRREGEVIGEMALLEDAPRTATIRAHTDCVFYAIGQEQFEYLLDTSHTASRYLLNTVLARHRGIMGAMRQNERMAQLGTLAAGIAHELNNPAAAVKRASGHLQTSLEHFANQQAQIALLSFSTEQDRRLKELFQTIRSRATQPDSDLDPLEQSDREYDIESWLDDQGVEDAWELAPLLVKLGYDVQELASFAKAFSPDQVPAIVAWLGANYEIYSLVSELSLGAGRISDIVKSMKAYSYLDQAPVQEVNVHEGLDNTLTIMRSKLRSIKVRREYATDLPTIQAYASELNQVWTNLIDNAADALAETPNPEIILCTSYQDGWVIVEVTDNGPGIPQEIQGRIFDPFFTTKEVGKGTGLGLDISYRIVVVKHRGDLKVHSRPGQTTFRVAIPIDFAEETTMTATLRTFTPATDEEMKRILQETRTIAVVGISSRAEKPAHFVPAYLQEQGYRIIPINPNLEEVLGEKAYPDLLAVPEPVDVVDIFRRSEDVDPIVEQAIAIKAKVVWMQEGIVNEEAADRARKAGLEVVMDACMKANHKRLLGSARDG